MRATIVILILAASCGSPQEAQQPQPVRRALVDSKPQTLEERWLSNACGVEDRRTLVKLVRAKGLKSEREYIRAMNQGPSKQDFDRMRASMAGLFEMRKYELKQEYFEKCIPSDVLDGAISLTKKSFTDQYVNCLEVAYRSRAIVALDLIESKRAIPHIRRLLLQDDLDPSIERAARMALKHADKRNR